MFSNWRVHKNMKWSEVLCHGSCTSKRTNEQNIDRTSLAHVALV